MVLVHNALALVLENGVETTAVLVLQITMQTTTVVLVLLVLKTTTQMDLAVIKFVQMQLIATITLMPSKETTTAFVLATVATTGLDQRATTALQQ